MRALPLIYFSRSPKNKWTLYANKSHRPFPSWGKLKYRNFSLSKEWHIVKPKDKIWNSTLVFWCKPNLSKFHPWSMCLITFLLSNVKWLIELVLMSTTLTCLDHLIDLCLNHSCCQIHSISICFINFCVLYSLVINWSLELREYGMTLFLNSIITKYGKFHLGCFYI